MANIATLQSDVERTYARYIATQDQTRYSFDAFVEAEALYMEACARLEAAEEGRELPEFDAAMSDDGSGW